MPSGIENDDYDSKGDILFLEKFLSNDSPSLPKNDSFHVDVPSSPLPPAKPPDDDEIEPDTGVLPVKVVGDISCNTLKSEHAAECLNIRGRYIYGSIAQDSENDY
ncbi:hypothetical protein Tco_0707725 [Tanacetum coccineum]